MSVLSSSSSKDAVPAACCFFVIPPLHFPSFLFFDLPAVVGSRGACTTGSVAVLLLLRLKDFLDGLLFVLLYVSLIFLLSSSMRSCAGGFTTSASCLWDSNSR